MAKTTCPITRSEFQAQAVPLDVIINGQHHQALVKEFSTGSLGWSLNGKATADIGGKKVQVQIGLNLTIIGSKELPRDPGSSGSIPSET
jgi:hypothetical protein